ncbi:BRO family protein [Pleionea sp. CnH1-48]|uniref:BRO family protein n=1 Tax=Pleionea sp. CnH1-48 TaxID=2954494 RepID=UPI0020970BB8|nr:phage antirepressor [Pleionea sp. CnH1-48]MCO7225763.1 phage antirepressor [Pleionea sp. CnH1-48]
MNVIPFEFEQNNIRIIAQDGEPWFVAKDVAEALGYKAPADTVRRHCKRVDETSTPINGIIQSIKIIPESDVFRLIMRSKLPSAERFEDWVVSEVLPSIRKTGGYMMNPDDISKKQVAQWLLESEIKVEQLEAQAEEDKPKVKAHDKLICAKNTLSRRDAAKKLDIRPVDLKEWMLNEKWIYRQAFTNNLYAYQDKLNAGLLKHKARSIMGPYGYQEIEPQIRITPKGLAKLAQQSIPRGDLKQKKAS